MAALAQLLAEDGRAAEPPVVNPFEPKKPHFPGKAKNVIFLFMEGAPSQIDLFDPKPALTKWHGQPLPPSMTKDLQVRVHQAECQGAGVQSAILQARPKRRGVQRLAVGVGADRRRSVLRPVHAHGRLQPPTRRHDPVHGSHAARASDDGFVGAVRSGKRVARSCRASSFSAPARTT